MRASFQRIWHTCLCYADEAVARSVGALRAAEDSNQLQVSTLEHRVLFSATPIDPSLVVDAAETGDQDDTSTAEQEEVSAPRTDVGSLSASELLVIDPSVPDLQALLDDLHQSGRDLEVVVLDADRDGIEQITELLDRNSNVDALHIVSHSNESSVRLGTSVLNQQGISGYAGQIAGWQDHLNLDADILFYGCDLASGIEGRQLLDSVAALTSADVAASDDVTGHRDLGGDWELEHTLGQIETQIAFSEQLQTTWTHTLPTFAPTVGLSGPVNFTEDLGPVLISPTASVGDVDSPHFSGGSLVIDIHDANGTADDWLGIRNVGPGVGEIHVTGGNLIHYNGDATPFAFFTGGIGAASPMVITFANAGATQAAVERLIENIGFVNNSDAPGTLDRTIEFVLTDADGNSNTPVASSLSVTPQNDAPTGGVSINGSPVEQLQLSASNNLSDVDGMTGSTVTYQWKRNGVDISGATGDTYTLVADDIGTMISVTATYFDDSGFENNVDSGSVGPVTANQTIGALVDSNGTRNSVNENAGIGTQVGVIGFANDPDSTVTYSLIDDDDGRFSIDHNTGVVSVASSMNREAIDPTRSITIRALSSDGSSSQETFQINLTDVDEFDVSSISDTKNGKNRVQANSPTGTSVRIRAQASDADATNNTITYSLDDDSDGRFYIEPTTGIVRVQDGSRLDPAEAKFVAVTVRATSSDGSFSTKQFWIKIKPAPGAAETKLESEPKPAEAETEPEVETDEPSDIKETGKPAPLVGIDPSGSGGRGNSADSGDDDELDALIVRQTAGEVFLASANHVYQSVSKTQSSLDAADHQIRQAATSRITQAVASTGISNALAISELDYALISGEGAMWEQMDSSREAIELHIRGDFVAAGVAGAAASSVTVGYVAWAIRSGFVLSGMLAQMPAWQSVDPLMVMQNIGNNRETLEQMMERRAKKLKS